MTPDVETDKHGHLVDLSTWSDAVCETLAAREGLELTDAHWEVLRLLRTFYAETQVSPAMRPLVRLVRERLDSEKGSSIYLMTLFGDSPARTAARLAGLPRPTNCL